MAAVTNWVIPDGVILNFADVAPSPSKDYCQILISWNEIIFRTWKISSRNDAKVAPGEIKDTFDDFLYDERTQSEIHRVFGKNMLDYAKRIAKGQIDYLPRLPRDNLIKIIRYLELEDTARLAQVSKMFRELCGSNDLWEKVYRDHSETMVTDDLASLAEAAGWKKLFFTNKLQLQMQLRRQSNKRSRGKKQVHAAGYDHPAFLTEEDG